MSLPASGEAETLMLLPVILCSVHMSFSICTYYLQVVFIFFTFCSSERKKSGGKELRLLGVLCLFLHVQDAATHLEDPGYTQRRDVEVCGCVHLSLQPCLPCWEVRQAIHCQP